MVSFRKAFLLLAVLVAVASIASAQVTAPALCTAYRSNAPNVRSEGVAEEVGQVVIQCTGGTSALRGTLLNRINVQIFLDTQVTSRRTIANDNSAIEAMMLIDDPKPNQVTTATMCAAGTDCPGTAVGGGIYNDPAGVIVNKNVYQGRLASSNSILWQGVPFDAPGTTPVRLLRIVNVRANANGLPLSTLLPTPIRMYITISGTAAPNLTVNQLEVAYLQKGLRFGSQDDPATFLQCETSEGSYGTTSSALKTFRIRFREWFPTAFRDNKLPLSGNQADLSLIYNSESMYYHPTVAGVWTGAGLGTQPTRLMFTMTGIPTNVIVRLPRQVVAGGDTIDYIQCFDNLGQNCSSALLGTGASIEPAIVGGTLVAVYEVSTGNPIGIADLTIKAELRWGPISSGIPGPPGTGTVTITGNYAPISTTTASILSPAPRFVIDPNDKPVSFTIAPCRTNLLFPYVTNQGGFDTGIVISNTSADTFGTVKQDGTCTLDYFGNINGAAIPAADASQTTETIVAGTQAIGLVSSGIKGTKGLAGFGGYVIAKCNFQYAHGYAFLYTGGAAFNGATGYLALVLDGDKDYVKTGSMTIDVANGTGTLSFNAPVTRTKSISEVRGQ